jgi:hypothetical protein
MLTFCAPNCELVKYIIKKPHSPITILNDDILLHIFYIYRLHTFKDAEDIFGSPDYLWARQRWWYKLAHVSSWWRRVILGAPTLLDLHLVCTIGVPVADMLAHSPPFPLTIFYRLNDCSVMKAKDEKGALLALSHRDHVRSIDLRVGWELEKVFVAMDGEFPILKHLDIDAAVLLGAPILTLPRTFRAPNLSHFGLTRVALRIQCPLLTTTGLTALRLEDIPGSGYFPPSYILASLSLMPQLETLWIMFDNPLDNPGPNRDIRDIAMRAHVTLPNLHKFEFRGVKAYLEGLCAWMTAPVLSVFHVRFSYPTMFYPNGLSFNFMQSTENFQFQAAELVCGSDYVRLQGVPQLGTWKHPFNLRILFRHFDWRMLSAIQILDALSPVLSLVEQVTLIVNCEESSQWQDEVDRSRWRGLFRSFSNVKNLHVETDVGDYGIGHSLRTEYGEQPLELLPNLEEVSYSGSDDENAFTPFINEREVVGRPVRLTRRVDDFGQGM